MSNFVSLHTGLTGIRAAQAEFGWFETTSELLQRAEGVLEGPNHGIAAQLGARSDVFENLAPDPSDSAVRQQVVSALDALAAQVRAVAKGWEQLAADGVDRLEGAVAEVNDLLAEVAEPNRRIGDVQRRGDRPNDVYDRSDLAVDRLASLVGATFTHEPGGRSWPTCRPPTAQGRSCWPKARRPASSALTPTPWRSAPPTPPPPVALRGDGELFAAQEFATAEPVAAHDGRNADWLAGAAHRQAPRGATHDDRLEQQIVGLASAVANSRRAAHVSEDLMRITTRRRILAPSDDPSAAGRALSLRASQRAREQEARNAADAATHLALADSHLQSAVDRLHRVRELAVKGASTLGDTDRAALGAELRAIQEELVGMANARHRGRPLFAGYQDVAAVAKVDGVWTYQCDDGVTTRLVGEQDVVAAGVTAAEVFRLGAGGDLSR